MAEIEETEPGDSSSSIDRDVQHDRHERRGDLPARQTGRRPRPEEPDDALDLEELGHPRSKPRAVAAPSRERGRRRPRDEDDEEEDRRERQATRNDEDEHEDEKKRDDEKKDDEQDKRWSPLKKAIVFGSIGLVLLLALAIAIPWYLHSRHFEQTDDAFIDAHAAMVAPQIEGRVIEVLVNDNQVVEAGQTILKLDPRDYQAALDQANAALAQAKGELAQAQAQREVAEANVLQAGADVDQAQANLENAQSQLQRYEGLSREAISPQRLDDLRTAVRNNEAQLTASQKRQSAQRAQITLAESQITAAQASVKAAQAKLEQAQLNLSYTEVKASVAGRVAQRSVQVGDYLQAGQRTLILVPHDVWVTANFKETQLADMRIGQPVTITVDAFPDEEFRGHVDSMQAGSGTVFSLLPPQNATGNYVKVVQRVPVKIVFDETHSEAYRRLGPGMSVQPKVRVR